MRRLPFLTSPGAWIRSSSRMSDAARDACAVERSRPTGSSVLNVLLVLVIGIAIALLLVHGVSS